MNHNTRFTIRLAAGICLLLSAFGFSAKAQPYYTNTSPQAGAYQYNQNYAQPLQPSKTLAAQYTAGILDGSQTAYAAYYTTVSFPTNIYTTAPAVTVTSSATNCIASVIAVTPTNFIFGVNVTNIITTNQWIAVGH